MYTHTKHNSSRKLHTHMIILGLLLSSISSLYATSNDTPPPPPSKPTMNNSVLSFHPKKMKKQTKPFGSTKLSSGFIKTKRPKSDINYHDLHLKAQQGIEVFDKYVKKVLFNNDNGLINKEEAKKRIEIIRGDQHIPVLFMVKTPKMLDHCLTKYGLDINIQADNNMNILLYNAWKGNLTMVKYLITEKGLNILYRNSKGRDTLLFAAIGGHVNVYEYILTTILAEKNNKKTLEEIIYNTKDNKGEDSIHCAARKGKTKILDYFFHKLNLARYTIAVDPTNNQECGLSHTAATAGSVVTLQYFAKLNSTKKTSSTPIEKLQKDYANRMLKLGTQDNQGKTSLHYAAQGNQKETFDYIITQDYTLLNKGDSFGFTPLMYLVRYGHLKLLKHVIEKHYINFKIAEHLDCEGMNLLSLATYYGQTPMFNYILDTYDSDDGALLNSVDHQGRGLILVAISNGQWNIYQHIKNKYTTPLICRDKSGKSLAGIAAHYGDINTLEKLWSENVLHFRDRNKESMDEVIEIANKRFKMIQNINSTAWQAYNSTIKWLKEKKRDLKPNSFKIRKDQEEMFKGTSLVNTIKKKNLKKN